MEELINKINELESELSNIKGLLVSHQHTGNDSIKIKYKDLVFNKQAAITAPTGGATVDTQARTAIGTLLTTLQALNLTN